MFAAETDVVEIVAAVVGRDIDPVQNILGAGGGSAVATSNPFAKGGIIDARRSPGPRHFAHHERVGRAVQDFVEPYAVPAKHRALEAKPPCTGCSRIVPFVGDASPRIGALGAHHPVVMRRVGRGTAILEPFRANGTGTDVPRHHFCLDDQSGRVVAVPQRWPRN